MIYICADDFGLSKESSKRIEECIFEGGLNKVSIMPNTPFAGQSIKNAVPSLHLNLVEGKPLSKNTDTLITENGYFKYSFGGLLLKSVFPSKKFKLELEEEIKEQLDFYIKNISPGKPLMVDSHQHVHMIPLIFKTLMKALKDSGADVKYVRIPSEPLMPYIKAVSLYLTYNPVNIIKQWVLKFLAFLNRKEIKKAGIAPSYFMGVLFSGKMDERVLKVLPYYKKLSEKRDIEILFHPGFIRKDEPIFDANKKGFVDFYLSEGRKEEYDFIKRGVL